MGTDEIRHLWAVPAGRALVSTVVVVLLLTVAGLGLLWPRGYEPHGTLTTLRPTTLVAKVDRTGSEPCPGRQGQRCMHASIRVGKQSSKLDLGPARTAPVVHAGDDLRVTRNVFPKGTPRDVVERSPAFSFVDVDRHGSVLLLAAILGVVAVVVLRSRGLLAIVGVGLSIALVTLFMVPALLDGKPALLVALVGSLAVMFVTLVLTNGVGAQTMAAAVAVTGTLALTGLAAVLAVHITRLDGRTTELASILTVQESRLSLQGIVLAGMLVGALGVLADTAVTQASAVMALRRTDPRLSARRLYQGAVVIGRDHLSATIHTLVLAYVGAALPLMLALRSVAVPTLDGLNSQDVSQPIVATVVGCLALIIAVPLTTFLASRLVTHIPVELLPEHDHAH